MAKSRFLMTNVLVLLLSGALGILVAHFFLPRPAELELEIRDGSFGEDLLGRSVKITGVHHGGHRTANVDLRGESQVVHFDRLTSGPLNLRIEVDGFREAQFQGALAPLQRHRGTLALDSIYGLAKLTVVDATSGQPIANARLTSPDGYPSVPRDLRLLLPPGEHRLAARADGFCEGERSVRLEQGQEVLVDLPLSPQLTANEAARTLLDWGENPRDLDAHVLLEQPSETLLRNHVYFSRKRGETKAGRIFAQLDIDHTNSEGFETVTLSNRVRGTYRYFVHLYAGSGTLGSSEATVTVTTRGCKKKVYHVPPDCTGRFWSVVDIKVDATTVDVLERGECSESPPRKWQGKK